MEEHLKYISLKTEVPYDKCHRVLFLIILWQRPSFYKINSKTNHSISIISI